MFGLFKRNSKLKVVSPVKGDLIQITDVNDDVFSTKMLGDGFAVEPFDGTIVASLSGKITTLFPTKHALGITTDKGLEVLIHMGIDTVELKGTPFDVFVKMNQEVKAGDKLAQINLDKIKQAGLADTIIVVYTNMDLLKSVSAVDPRPLSAGDVVQEIEYK
ncbi:PTS glucose transporter subunit IIA [Lactobacillus mulieris]|uniref:PTS sugar transporter subunit IIA n=1 Tax=Lactobacillus mulieris TaxID=2508708 RepID=UPI0036F4AF3A